MKTATTTILTSIFYLTTAAVADVVVPPGLSPGDPYYLTFVTQGKRDGLSSSIADYNTFVNDEAALNQALTGAGVEWYAIASTATVAARDNAVVDPGVPIYLLDGTTKIADGYADLWDGSIDAQLRLTQFLGLFNTPPAVYVWTGTQVDGSSYGGNLPLGAAFPASGRSDFSTSFWIANGNTLPDPSYSLYALSEKLFVPAGPPQDPVVPADLNPGDVYHLVFVTQGVRDGTSSAISDYNAFVNSEAALNESLTGTGTQWFALASTATVAARDNAPVGTNVPVYLLDGTTRIADGFADLWDGTIASELEFDQFLVRHFIPTFARVWSGTQFDGSSYGGNLPLGAMFPSHGRPDFSNSNWIANGNTLPDELFSLYALSEPLVVPTPPQMVPLVGPTGLTILVLALTLSGSQLIRRHQRSENKRPI